MTHPPLLRLLPLAAALLVLLLTGLVYGLWTGRWHTAYELEEAAASVATVPQAIGDWHGEDEAADAESFRQAGAAAYWIRRYRRGGEQVTAILMCGTPKKLVVHTPLDCYGGAGYEAAGSATRQTVQAGADGETGEFWTARFKKPASAGGGYIRIDWAWKGRDSWQAPQEPRWAFRGNAFLYKLYIIREAADEPERTDADPGQTLLLQMLPTLKQSLYSPPAS